MVIDWSNFFAMRSCEYLKTSSKEESKRTRILRIKNFTFVKNKKVLSLKSKNLHSADLVKILFEFQKNDVRNQSVHMFKTKDKVLNPVIAWSNIIYKLWDTIPGASLDTKVCEFWSGNKIIDLTSYMIRSHLKAAVEVIGEGVLGFTKDDIGLHSLRSGGAMAMFLSGVHEIIIKRVGRWSSEAFLEYIREQVDSFTVGVSDKMLEHEEFHLLNDKTLEDMNDKITEEISSKSDGGAYHIPLDIHYSKSVLSENVKDLIPSINH